MKHLYALEIRRNLINLIKITFILGKSEEMEFVVSRQSPGEVENLQLISPVWRVRKTICENEYFQGIPFGQK
jgi:hypothetical protein